MQRNTLLDFLAVVRRRYETGKEKNGRANEKDCEREHGGGDVKCLTACDFIKMCKNRLAAGLRPDPQRDIRDIKRSPRPVKPQWATSYLTPLATVMSALQWGGKRREEGGHE
jgi:hypothetical protein